MFTSISILVLIIESGQCDDTDLILVVKTTTIDILPEEEREMITAITARSLNVTNTTVMVIMMMLMTKIRCWVVPLFKNKMYHG